MAAWLGESGTHKASPWFRLEASELHFARPVPDEQLNVFEAMTQELVELRLAQYRRRASAGPSRDLFELKVLWNKRDPILKLPSRQKFPDFPRGEISARLPDGSCWQFRLMSEFSPVRASSQTVAIALHVQTIRPEDLAPNPGSLVFDADLPRSFGVSRAPRGLVQRVDGHLFLCVEAPGVLRERDRVEIAVADRRPAETAFVLMRSSPSRPWRYCGVGRWSKGAWTIPPVDDQTWFALGMPDDPQEETP